MTAVFEQEHEAFRASFRTFLEREVVPFHAEWEDAGVVPRSVWEAAGKHGFLAMAVPEQYGGMGVDDFRFNAIVGEELVRAHASGPGFVLHNDVALPYLLTLTNDEQKQRWLPRLVTGELITAIAMTEPGAGSDLASMRTTARRDGDSYVLSGAKTFITNGQLADLIIVACKTDPEAGARGVSLLVVEGEMAGFDRGRNLDKLGMSAQDTSELFFDEVRVPAANLLGEENAGFRYLMVNLAQERLSIALGAVVSAECALERTVDYVTERQAFGQSIGSFQHSRFTLAELKTEVTIARVFVDHCLAEHLEGRLTPESAAMAKWWTTELQLRVIDRCLQLHGGYGFMREFRIAKDYVDYRAQTIYGGSTEIMKEIIGRSMGLR
jgi:alkylation response protein AidB-like acyl-CoA dehydrogenase